MKSSRRHRYFRTMAFVGIGMLLIAILLLVGGLLGLVPLTESAVLGQSGLRSIAALAVAGCLLAAIGFWED